MQRFNDTLIKVIEENGWKGAILPIYRLNDLADAIFEKHTGGLIEDEFYMDQLGSLVFEIPRGFDRNGSIVIIAVPTPRMRVYFNRKNKRIPVIIPPTYVSYTRRTKETLSKVSELLENEGFRSSEADIPLKSAAVCSGLATYGRNNICYAAGMGSFLQLAALFTDLPCDTDSWRKPEMLIRCNSCVACVRNCPTGAITRERFLIHAGKCLTYFNESKRDFPEWLDLAWHNCLVGCMMCQSICPENRSVTAWIEDRVEFSEQETEYLISSVPFDQLPAETVDKIQNLEINEDYGALCRNLRVLIDN